MVVSAYKATWTSWKNEPQKAYFADRLSARMFAENLSEYSFKVKVELVNVEHTEYNKYVWR